MGNPSLYGLGLDSTYTYDRESPVGTLDSNLQVVQRKAPPNDVPQSPGESPAISSGSPTMPGEVPAASSSVPAAGRNLSSPLPSSSSRPQARPARSQARVRTVSLASLLGLGIPDSSTFDFEMTVNNSTVDHGITGLSGPSLSDVRHAGASTFDSGMTKGARDEDGDGGISGLGGQTLSEGSHVGMSTFDSTATRRVVEGGPGDDNGRPALTGQGSSEGHAPYVQRVFDWNNGSVSDVLDFAAGDVSRDAGGPELDFLHSHDSRRASAHEANGLGDDFLNSYDSRRSDVHQRNDDFLQSQDPRRTMTRTQGSHGHGEDDFLQSYDPRRVSAHERNGLGDDFLQSHDSRRVSVHEEVGAHGTAMHLLSPSIGAPSRTISYATSGHEASMGHHSHPHVSSPPFPLPQSNRAWGESGGGARRGSIGASQPARSPAMTDGDAFERSAEDDVVAELPPTTSHMGTASARGSVQSQGAGAGAGAGPSRHGSGIYTPSEVDTDADSLMDAEVVMASRIELQRGGLGSGRNEGHPASLSSSAHLDVGHPHDASERPVSMDARQRKMLEQEMEREASRESAKLVGGGQTLRPLVVEDGHLRYSRQAEIVSGSDIERSDASGFHGDEPVPVEARHGSDADLPQSSLPNAENDATAERSPSMQTGAESTIRSTSARRRARKLSYATAEEAIAARRQEQAEREERMRAREAKRQADRQARYANKKKTDPLLAARLALFGLQAPEAGSGGSEQQHQRTGSSERSGTPRSVELARAEYQGAEHSSSGGGEGPLLRFSDLVDMDDDQLDVPCESTGRDDTRSMLVQQGPHILDQRVSMPGPDVWPGMGGGATYGDSQEDVNGPLTDFGGISVQTDWHSAQSHHHRRASSTQRMVAASPVSPSFPAEAYRSSPASPQVPK
ncbi:unnamed protein product [Tilletia controversa]|nr:unnamed protein product [Tilletia controversa]